MGLFQHKNKRLVLLDGSVYSAARTVHVCLYKVSFFTVNLDNLKLIMSYYLLNSLEVFEET